MSEKDRPRGTAVIETVESVFAIIDDNPLLRTGCTALTSDQITWEPSMTPNGDMLAGSTNWDYSGLAGGRELRSENRYGFRTAGLGGHWTEYSFAGATFTAGKRWAIEFYIQSNVDPAAWLSARLENPAETLLVSPMWSATYLSGSIDVGLSLWAKQRICWTPAANRSEAKLRIASIGGANSIHYLGDVRAGWVPTS